MERPRNLDRPFFAYRLLRPGQLAFFQLRDLISEITEPARVPGKLRLRDGLPLVEPTEPGEVKGALLTFVPERVSDAYDRISAMEPDKHYRWDEAQIGGSAANLLVDRYRTSKGSVPCGDAEWNGWVDP